MLLFKVTRNPNNTKLQTLEAITIAGEVKQRVRNGCEIVVVKVTLLQGPTPSQTLGHGLKAGGAHVETAEIVQPPHCCR